MELWFSRKYVTLQQTNLLEHILQKLKLFVMKNLHGIIRHSWHPVSGMIDVISRLSMNESDTI